MHESPQALPFRQTLQHAADHTRAEVARNLSTAVGSICSRYVDG